MTPHSLCAPVMGCKQSWAGQVSIDQVTWGLKGRQRFVTSPTHGVGAVSVPRHSSSTLCFT